VVNAPIRLKAELQTGVVRGYARRPASALKVFDCLISVLKYDANALNYEFIFAIK